jgi:cbb3-type cytochrome oxidase subunit 1
VPTLTRWFLRAAMVHLVAALALGLLISVPALAAHAAAWRPVYIHLLVVGWATQMIFGVAFWMFPRTEPLDLTAVPWTGWTCFWALNAGLVLRAACEPVIAERLSAAASAGAALAAALQLLAVAAFVALVWRRVKTR